MKCPDGEIITVREGCPHIREKSILKIDEYDIVIMEIAHIIFYNQYETINIIILLFYKTCC